MIEIKIKYIISSTVIWMCSRKKDVAMSLLMFSISFLVLGYALLIMLPNCFISMMASNVFRVDIQNIYRINMWQYKVSQINETAKIPLFLERIKDIEGIEASGSCYLSTADYDEGEAENNLFIISSSLLYMTDKKDIEGRELSLTSQEEPCPAIVGYELKDKYPIGSVIVLAENGKRTKYVVSQILEKGSKWMDADMDGTQYINLDTRIMIAYDNILNETPSFISNGLNSICFVMNEAADREYVMEKVVEAGQECGISICGIKNLKDIYASDLKDLLEEKDTFIMPFILILLSITAIIVSSMINIHTRRREIGGLYISGYSRANIASMYLIENIFTAAIAVSVSSAYWNIKQRDFFSMSDVSYMWLVTPCLILFAVIVSAISSVFPLIRINRFSPPELVE